MRRTTAAIAIAVALVLGGCSDSTDPDNFESNGLQEKTALVIFQTGAKATTEVTDVVATGSLPVDGVGSKVVSRFGGVNAESRVTNRKYTFEVKTNGTAIWVRGEEDFWKEQVGTAQAKRIGSRWAVTLIDGPLAPFAQFVDLDFFFRASGRITKGDEGEIDGRPTITVTDPPANTDASWWFATTGDPVLLKWESGDKTSFALTYDETVLVTTPAGDESVDINTITVPKGNDEDS